MDNFFINPTRFNIAAHLRHLRHLREGATDPKAWADLDASGSEASDYDVVNGTAVIPVRGTLVSTQIAGWYWYGGCTYEGLIATVERAVNDPDVARVLMAFNTPGGTVTGCAEAAAKLDILSGRKDIWAHCNMADSAGYWLASATNRIIVDPTGEVGSIGVITTHTDMSKMLEEWGIDVTHIFSGAHKADGSPYAPLSDSAKERIQGDIDHLRGVFVDSVASYRQVGRDALMNTEALTYIGTLAVDSGLADDTGFFTDVLNAMAEQIASGVVPATASKEEPSPMAKKPPKAATPTPKASEDEDDKNKAAPADETASEEDEEEEAADKKADDDKEKDEGGGDDKAASAERSRIDAILSHKEAAGRDDLARHLALKTGMSARDAGNILAAAPKQAEKPAGNPLADAMNKTGNPTVGSDTPTGAAAPANAAVEDMKRRYAK